MQELIEDDKDFDFDELFEYMKDYFVLTMQPDMLRKMQIAAVDGIEELKNAVM